MSTRIPPSLKWLIDKRARVAGKIDALQETLSKIEGLEKILSSLREDLAGIDRVLTLHEIQVNIEYIHPISPRPQRIELPYGELTQSLLSFLRLNKGEPLSTDALTIMLIRRFAHLQIAAESEVVQLRKSVRKRLKNLAADRIIVRVPNPYGKQQPSWIIPTATDQV